MRWRRRPVMGAVDLGDGVAVRAAAVSGGSAVAGTVTEAVVLLVHRWRERRCTVVMAAVLAVQGSAVLSLPLFSSVLPAVPVFGFVLFMLMVVVRGEGEGGSEKAVWWRQDGFRRRKEGDGGLRSEDKTLREKTRKRVSE